MRNIVGYEPSDEPRYDDVPLANVQAGTRLYAEIRKRPIPNRRVYLHPWGTQVYELKSRNGEAEGDDGGAEGVIDGKKKAASYFRPVSPWGCARLNGIVQFLEHEAPAGARRCYEITAREITAVSSRKEVHSGEWAERHGVPGAASRSSHAEWADIIEWQEILCGPVPIHQGRNGTGWGEVNGRHAHALPNGVWLGAVGPVPGAKAYMHLAAEHLAPYADLDAATLADLHAHPDTQAQATALGFRAGIDDNHIALLIDAAFWDSLLYPLHRPAYGVLVRGPSGTGKTSRSDSGRNYLGRFGLYKCSPTGSMFDTTAAVERHATQLKHEPTTIDDLVIRKEDPPATKSEKARMLRAILHSVGNNTPVRRRMGRDMQEQPSYKFETVPVLTSEQLLPDMAESDLNRAVVLRLDQDSVAGLKRLQKGLPKHLDGMLGAGLGYVAYIAARWDADGDEFADELRARHAALEQQMLADMLARRDAKPLPSEADRLPANGAHLLLAISVMQDYCTAAGVPYTFGMDAIRADLVNELVAQVDLIQALMTGSHNGVAFDEWVGGVLRRIVDEGQRHVATPDGELPDPHYLSIQSVRLGWRERGWEIDPNNKDKTRPQMRPAGALLAVTSQKCQHLCAEKTTLFDVLSREAAREGRPFPATVDEMMRELARYNMIARGDGSNLERKIRIGNTRPRRVWIVRRVVWPELSHPTSGPTCTTKGVGPLGPLGPLYGGPELQPTQAALPGPTLRDYGPTPRAGSGHLEPSSSGPTPPAFGPTSEWPLGPDETTPTQAGSTLTNSGPSGPSGPTPNDAYMSAPARESESQDIPPQLVCPECGPSAHWQWSTKWLRWECGGCWRDVRECERDAGANAPGPTPDDTQHEPASAATGRERGTI
jgi:hypothetical protein